MADGSATQKIPHLILLLSATILCTQVSPFWSADGRRVVTVPALVCSPVDRPVVHYIVPQIDKDSRQEAPTVQFNEISLGGGSIVSEDWKEGVRHAVIAATKTVGETGGGV